MTDPMTPVPPIPHPENPAGPGAADFDAVVRALRRDPGELRAFLTAALADFDRDGDASALRVAVAAARDAQPEPGDAA